MNIIATKEIRNRILSGEKGQIYMLRDFSGITSDAVVATIMSRLEKEGLLVRLSQGIYLYPKRTRFGIVYPSTEEIARAIAAKDGARIIPSGLTALNKLGLSTQVPMKAVYLTDATAREIKVNGQTLIFKRTTPRIFMYTTSFFSMVVTALKQIGEKKVSESEILHVKKLMQEFPDQDALKNDYNLAPIWIKKALA